MSKELIDAMIDLDDEKVVEIVSNQLNKRKPLEIIEDLKSALTKIGELFDDEEYFLSDLIIAAEAFKEASKLIEPHFKKKTNHKRGKIVIGTVEGDMHDIGKNIIITLLKSEGFKVIDLGIDVSPEKFLESVKEIQPDIVGLSGLLTSSKEPMKKTIELLRENYDGKLIFVVGGVAINDAWISDVGADYGTTNAVTGLKIINELV
ncbi:MAG: hypothetical protein GF383_00670 [Candidatus Lokiarchaeota archaeon]|nr:hypothetical protein [Candidatus Lokiarchaeota archaeon]MBD3337686.1 hypothetical protein [Candidatus Lokiarchaeota archaeon]